MVDLCQTPTPQAMTMDMDDRLVMSQSQLLHYELIFIIPGLNSPTDYYQLVILQQ